MVLTAPLLYEEVHGSEVLTYLVWVSTWLVYLVDGKHHRHVSCLSMSYSLLGGRHDRVVGSNDDDSDIGNLCTTGTHGGERLVTRGVEEGDATSVRELNVVGTDVLSDATSLTCYDVGVAHVVEQ